MLNEDKILQFTTNFIVPFIILFSVYIQLNGEASPGGGFQAGAIFASCIIAIEHALGKKKFESLIKHSYLLKFSTFGVALYAVVGLICLAFGYNYLDYYALLENEHLAQTLGIFLVELGVGICVSSSLVLLYFEFLRL